MAKPRKKWRVDITGRVATTSRVFATRPAAYRHFHGAVDVEKVRVYVDEGMGRGWQLYETFTAEELGR